MVRKAFSTLLFITGFLVAFVAHGAEELRVAFIGDQGFGHSSTRVLKMIKAEGAELVVHQGDFDYLDQPQYWERQINKHLGNDFPYIASVGNHDTKMWSVSGGYRDLLHARARRVPGLSCTGDHGVNGACVYKGLLVVTSGVGSMGDHTFQHLQGILNQSDDFTWKVCSWHKQMAAYQVGSKGDAVPWKYYRACREAGAIIAQGHEHSYSRTHTMAHFEDLKIHDKEAVVKVGRGLSFAFTNGLGGASIRKQKRCKKAGSCPHWASIYTKSQKAKAGALFCTFRVDGIEDLARCYFKNIKGQVIDQFDIHSLNKEARSLVNPSSPPETVWFPTSISKGDHGGGSESSRQSCL